MKQCSKCLKNLKKVSLGHLAAQIWIAGMFCLLNVVWIIVSCMSAFKSWGTPHDCPEKSELWQDWTRVPAQRHCWEGGSCHLAVRGHHFSRGQQLPLGLAVSVSWPRPVVIWLAQPHRSARGPKGDWKEWGGGGFWGSVARGCGLDVRGPWGPSHKRKRGALQRRGKQGPGAVESDT